MAKSKPKASDDVQSETTSETPVIPGTEPTEPTTTPTPAEKPKGKGGKPKDKEEVVISRAECPDGGVASIAAFKDLTFDPAYQMRAELVNEDTAARYAEMMADGAVFPPLFVANTGVKRLVFSGFNRGRAYELAKIKDVPVIEWKMTEHEAKKWALRQNSSHGKTRTDRDVRKAINTLLDDAELLAEIAKGGGGQRAIAAAVGVSTGALYNALEARGEALRGGKLIKVDKKKDKEPAAPDATDDGIPSDATGSDSGTGGKTADQLEDEAKRAQVSKISDDGFPRLTRNVIGNLVRMVEASITRESLAPYAKASLEKFGFVIELDEFGQQRLPVLTRMLDAYADLENTLKGLEAEKSFEADKAKSTEPAEGEPANLNA